MNQVFSLNEVHRPQLPSHAALLSAHHDAIVSNGADDQMLILLSLAAAVDDTLTDAHNILASEARGDINRRVFNAPVHKQPAPGDALATFTASILVALTTEGYEFIAEFARVLVPPV